MRVVDVYRLSRRLKELADAAVPAEGDGRLKPGEMEVMNYLAENPGATTYTVSPYSSSLRKVVTLHCTRAEHLSECTGGSNVRLWVSDSVG